MIEEMRISSLLSLPLVALIACGGTQVDRVPPKERYVRNIELTSIRAEVGKRFQSQVSYQDNFLRNPEVQVNGLPSELHYDAASRSVVGVPRHPGFYPIQVAIREQVERGFLHTPRVEERWWTADFTLEIYAPLGE
jgi:hypothetical protein